MPNATNTPTHQQNVGFLRCVMNLKWALQDTQRSAVIVGQGAEELRQIAPVVERLEKLAKKLPLPVTPVFGGRQPAQVYHGD